MQRYDGRQLRLQPHIAVLGSCKVGNFVITLPLLRLLRKRFPEAKVDFWGTEATRDFEIALCGTDGPLDWRISWDSPAKGDSRKSRLEAIAEAKNQREIEAGKLDLVINCDGFNPLTQTLCCLLEPDWVAGASLSSDGRSKLKWGEKVEQRFLADADWDSKEFLKRYEGKFSTNYIAELMCRMAFLEPKKKDLESIELPWEEPKFTVPEILIHTTTTRAAKIWKRDAWGKILEWCAHRNYKVGLVGAPPKRQQSEYHAGDDEERLLESHPSTLIDLRGKTSLIQLAGACKEAKAVVSVDAGPMHIAAAVGTATLAVVGNDAEGVGASPVRLWLPRSSNVARTVSKESCALCSENQFRNDDCIAKEQICMQGVEAEEVIKWLTNIFK